VFPPKLAAHWAMRGYYGTLSHNVKATYVNYLGWFDGNPANLHTHEPVEAAKRYVVFMGGAAATLDKARGAYDLGDYRWVAEVVNHVVFAEPDNQDARALQAAALEQLGYQSESGPWRNFYLSAAQELRHGVAQVATPSTGSLDVIGAMSTELFVDYLGMRLNGSKAGDRAITLALTLPDVGEEWTLLVCNGALSHRTGAAADADAHVTITRANLNGVILGTASLTDQIADGRAHIEGDQQALLDFIGLLDTFAFWFDIVTP
jgi:alkyl sulfatase BDS1-like metallo-beta-lactamase superfamily hydrolase